MSIKLKALGLGLLATMALAGFMAMNATAETGGHFTSETAHTIIKGTESGTHTTKLEVPGLSPIVCTVASYEGTANATTVESLTVTPTYGAGSCHTVGGAAVVNIDVNGCQYTFTIGKKSTADNTVDLVCPGATKFIGITHEGCEIRVPAQNGIKGVSFTTDVLNGKHAITLDVTAHGFTTNFEAGFCILLGTSHVSNLDGSVTVHGTDTAGNPVGITATGSEG